MRPPPPLLAAALLVVGLLLAPRGAAADDVVVLVNDQRVVGRILSEDGKRVVIQQQTTGGGHATLTIPREQIRAIERGTSGAPASPAGPAAPASPAADPAEPPAAPSPVAVPREEWWLLESDGKVVGTRHVIVARTPAAAGGATGWHLEEQVVLFARKRVLGARVVRIEDVDDRLFPRTLYYRESGDSGEGALGYETIRSGEVRGGAWTYSERAGGKARDARLTVLDGARGPLAAREARAREEPRRTGLDDVVLLDAARAEVRAARLGFASLDHGEGDEHADVMRFEDGGRVLESRWAPGQPPRCLGEDVAPGVSAVAATAAQVEAAAGGAVAPAPGPAPRRELSLVDVGASITLPGASWTGEAAPSRPLDAGPRVVARASSPLLAADVRVEWDPRGAPTTGASPEEAETTLLARLRTLAPDLHVVAPRAPVGGLPGAWRMTLEGTVRGERLETLVLVADRGAGRVVVLASSPATAWADARVPLESILASFRWL